MLKSRILNTVQMKKRRLIMVQKRIDLKQFFPVNFELKLIPTSV